MGIADSIIRAMETKSTGFAVLRSKMRRGKPLNKADFKILVGLLGTDAKEILSTADLTVSECEMVGKALLAAKLRDVEKVIDCVILKQPTRAAMLLRCILNKGCKLDVSGCLLGEYLKSITLGDAQLCHLKLLLVVSKNYPQLIDQGVIEFCTGHTHPICKLILEKHQVVCE